MVKINDVPVMGELKVVWFYKTEKGLLATVEVPKDFEEIVLAGKNLLIDTGYTTFPTGDAPTFTRDESLLLITLLLSCKADLMKARARMELGISPKSKEAVVELGRKEHLVDAMLEKL